MSMTRTDLALESVQAAAKAAREDAVPGVRSQENRREGYAITHIRIDSDVGAQALGKPVGRYITVDLGPYFRREEDYFDRGVRCLAQELRGMLPEGPVLAAGLGPFVRLGVQYLLYKLTAFLAGMTAAPELAKLIDALGGVFGLMLGMTGSCALLLLISISSAILVVTP